MPGVPILTADEIRLLPPALTVEQAAGLLRIGRSKAYQAVKSGEWPTRVVRVGRCIRIPTADVLRLLGLPSDDLSKEEQQ
jgi:excisionase family DNA binding protein